MECIEFLKVLPKFEEFLNITLGIWKTDLVYFKLKEDANLVCSRPYPVLKVQEK